MRALWSDKQDCSRNVSQKFQRIRRFSDKSLSKIQKYQRNTAFKGTVFEKFGRGFEVKSQIISTCFDTSDKRRSIGF